jgi:hypothetical protein
MKTFLFALLSCFAQAAVAEQLLCRGPLPYAMLSNGDDAVIFIDKNSTPAGERGVSLAAGKCAFFTRAMAADDPTRIIVDMQNPQQGARPWFVAFASCAGNPRCVFEFDVAKKFEFSFPDFKPTNAHFRGERGFGRVHFPVFP